MKKIMILCILFCCSYTSVFAEIITVHQNQYNISLIVEDTCQELHEQVFRIERLNYTANSTPTEITYHTNCSSHQTTINKTINKYTQSKTGHCIFNQTNNYTVTFTLENHTTTFEKEINCNNQEENNNTKEKQILIQEDQEESVCFSQAQIILNKQVFQEEDQLTMDFILTPKPKDFEIIYWIETYNNTILKKERATTNTNTKTHTFKKINEEEQGAFVKATISDECHNIELEELILLVGEAEEKEVLEPSIIIKSFQEKNNYIKLVFEVQTEQKKTLSVDVISKTGTTIFSQKIKPEEKETQLVFEIHIPKPEEELVDVIILQGELQESKQLELTPTTHFELLKTYTKQTYYENNITWYVRTKQDKPLLIEINTSNSSIYKYITETGEHTTSINIPYEGKEITTTIYQNNNKEIKKDHLQLTKKNTKTSSTAKQEITLQEEIVIPTYTIKTPTQKNTTVPLLEEETRTSNVFSLVSKQGLYGLLGLLLAGITYFILKE